MDDSHPRLGTAVLIARHMLAHLLFVTDNRNALDPEEEWNIVPTKYRLAYFLMADAVIAAGYVKPE